MPVDLSMMSNFTPKMQAVQKKNTWPG